MIPLSPKTRIYLACGTTDMRKGFDGLAGKQLADRGLTLPMAPAQAASFVPAVIEPAPSGDPVATARRPRRRRRSQPSPVELEIDGVAVKIARGADAHVIAAVIEALKATR